jgi:outer membrane protein TolC
VIRLTGIICCLALLPGLGGAALAGEARVLEWDEYLREAWSAAPRTEAQRAEVLAAGRAGAQAAAARRPNLGLELSGGWVSRVQELQLPGRSVEFGDGTSVDAALKAGWTLYAGGSLRAAERRAAHELRARGEEALADSLARLAELRDAFYLALAAEAVQEVAKLGVDGLERARADLAARHAAGTLQRDALLLAEGRLAGARAELALREGELRVARRELASLAGHPEEEWRPRGDLERPLPEMAGGARRSPALLALDARLMAGREAELQSAAWRRPRVEASAAWHLARPGVDPVSNEWMDYTGAGLRVAWSIWDNRLGRLREEETRLRRRVLEQRLKEAERVSSGGLVQVRELLVAALDAQEAVALREELEIRRLELVETRWRSGMATEREWLDAQDDVRHARLDRAAAAARVRRTEIRLLQAKGL